MPRNDVDHLGEDAELVEARRASHMISAALPRNDVDHLGEDADLVEARRASHMISAALPRNDVDHVASDGMSLPDAHDRGGALYLKRNEYPSVTIDTTDVKSVDNARAGVETRAQMKASPNVSDERKHTAAAPRSELITHGRVPQAKFDESVTNRTTATKASAPMPHRDSGRQVDGIVQSNLAPELSSEHYGNRAAETNTHMPSAANRIGTSRTTYSQVQPANASATCEQGMTARPLPSTSSSGLVRTNRNDSRANAKTPQQLLRSNNVVHNIDRSTPTRSLTPSMASDARWTPTVQMESSRGQRVR